ncbi:type I-MYXAN CRISPR-associated protein Cas6/Cmx6 [Paenibacillus cisolokensis]|uniref:type I-MYXAN CRISPR-associated protein Cas6/Cmx6 n=1 Tax=Paenibacillus cisolokensis TaxID=1658519 RepID=UPI003D287DCC
MLDLEIVRCKVPILGSRTIPFDTGYWLYAAISRIEPGFHEADQYAISPIERGLAGSDGLALTPQSYFWLQCPLSDLGMVYRLAGKQAVLGDYRIRFGIPRPEVIRPASELVSRLVTVKNKTEPDELAAHIRSRLYALNESVTGKESQQAVEAIRIEILRRRVFRIKDKRIVGFGVRLRQLSDRMSLLVQCHSVSGRRRFGCGFFTSAGGSEEGA